MDRADIIKKENICLGLLAHVDAGKTTLSEGLLYLGGSIRKMGRVDRRDAFLDTDDMEKQRGITIYSKPAMMDSPGVKGRTYTLLDTPGHTDFMPEMERVLSVLDTAVLLISAADGVNASVRTLFRLLAHYKIPSVIFVNKTDQAGSAEEAGQIKRRLLSEMKERLDGSVIDFSEGTDSFEVQENLVMASESEELLEAFMGGIGPDENVIKQLFSERRFFPVLFGSALKMNGVAELLSLIDRLAAPKPFLTGTAARVIKIMRDENGERETLVRVTGGSLKVRQTLEYQPLKGASEDENDGEEAAPEPLREKINRIRCYSGDRSEALPEAPAGMVCAVTGLTATYAGQGLGEEKDLSGSLIQPVLAWQVLLPEGTDAYKAYRELTVIGEEEPMMQLSYDPMKKEIRAHLMGRVQREVLADQVKKRFGLEIGFGRPSVIYKETIEDTVEGVGHFEPLRHYAEVHLMLSPGEPGSGLVFASDCPSDVLSGQYQRSVISSLSERRNRGVLTGSGLTDMKITLVAGRSHIKHTEGGDFRQASIRALRQGLMMAKSVLLEPFYEFEISLPKDNLGRAMGDLSNMGAEFSQPEVSGETAVIRGRAPVAAFDGYQEIMTAYTKGEAYVFTSAGGFSPCRNPEEVIAESGYDPEQDRRNPSFSVFCEGGAAVAVPWDKVREYMHVHSGWYAPGEKRTDAADSAVSGEKASKSRKEDPFASDKELMEIFERTYGAVGSRNFNETAKPRRVSSDTEREYVRRKPTAPPSDRYLLVDGYNIIFAWKELHDLAVSDVKAARDRLLDILSNYTALSGVILICVFDAYKVPGGTEHTYRYHNIDVVFTKEAETADQYIEKTAHRLAKNSEVTVATSDGIEQVIIFGAGAKRMPAQELKTAVAKSMEEAREVLEDGQTSGRRLGSSFAEKIGESMRHNRQDG